MPITRTLEETTAALSEINRQNKTLVECKDCTLIFPSKEILFVEGHHLCRACAANYTADSCTHVDPAKVTPTIEASLAKIAEQLQLANELAVWGTGEWRKGYRSEKDGGLSRISKAVRGE